MQEYNLNSRAQGYMHQCTIPANGMNLVIFDLGRYAQMVRHGIHHTSQRDEPGHL